MEHKTTPEIINGHPVIVYQITNGRVTLFHVVIDKQLYTGLDGATKDHIIAEKTKAETQKEG